MKLGFKAASACLILLCGTAQAQDEDLDSLFGSDENLAPAPTATPQPTATPAAATITLQDQPPPRVAKPAGRRTIEEIVVTAQKREQAIQDVPISMTALTEEFLIEQGVTDVGEALQLVPNASVDAAGFFAAPRIRGFTFNNNNKSFEPPVGMALDGIPHTRVPYFLAALFDVQRMEVLRGPQGTSFGKNTTAGLIHVISNGPSEEETGYLSAELGELNRRHLEAAYGGPLSDELNFRIAGLFDSRDGYIANTTAALLDTAPKQLKDRERSGLRATFEFPDLNGSRLQFAYENFELYDGGAALETMVAGPAFQEAVRRYDPNADFIKGNWVQSQDLQDFRDVSIWRARGLWEKDFADWSVTALAAHAVLEQELALDTDFEPAEAVNGFGSDTSPMSYVELRTVVPTLNGLFGLGSWGTTETLIGITASRREILDSHFRFGINNGPFYDLVAAASVDAGGGPGLGGFLDQLPINPTDTDASYDEFDQVFEQHADAYSVYGHTKWQLSQQWGLELSGRYTQEKKTANWDSIFTGEGANATLVAIGAEEFTANRSREESALQPKVSLNWQPSDAYSVFLHWEKGFKGGGFNAFAFREGNDPVRDRGFEDDDLSFEEEVAKNWGLDFKTQLLGGAAQVNISLFQETATDFQVLIRENPDGTIGLGTSRVVNAEKARAQGVEADALWLATDWLTLAGSLGFLDTEFISFVDGECPAGTSNRDQDGDGNPRCDQSGRPFPFAPEISATLSLRVNVPFNDVMNLGAATSDLSFQFGTLIEYESEQNLDVDLEDSKWQKAYTRYKADFGIKNIAAGWSLRLLGENLTNTVTHVRYGDIFENVIVGSQRAPRLFYLQFRQNF
ncbi:MAG: TonB-dependent receptor [Oceanococcus sp.]